MAFKHTSLEMVSHPNLREFGSTSTLSAASRRSRAASEAPSVTAISGGLALETLTATGAVASEGDIYYDAPDADFAQPAIQAVMDELGIQWLEDRIAQAQKEHAAHERMCAHAADPGLSSAWHTAAELLSTAVGGGLTGGLNFGVFAVVVGQVSAALNHGPAGFGFHDAKRFGASAAGRQVIANILGAVPGSLAYAVCGALSATALRPLVDAAALLLSAGRVTPVMPVDPALVYPTPSPMDAAGWPKQGSAYTAELEQNAVDRAAMAGLQADMLSIGDKFNLKYGTPLFAVCHAMRTMYLTARLLQGRAPGALLGAAFSSLSSGSANGGLLLLGTQERLRSRIAVGQAALPLFLPMADLRRIRGEPEPPLCTAAARMFSSAARAYVADAGVVRKLTVGVAASALAIFASTLVMDVLLPLGTLLATSAQTNDAGSLLISGVSTALAFTLTYLCVGKSLAWFAGVVRRKLEHQHTQRLEAGFRAALENFQQRYPEEVDRIAGGRRGSWTVAQIGAIFDTMNGVVLADLDRAVAERRNSLLEPGADDRLRTAYAQHAMAMRALLLGASAAEALPLCARSPAQQRVLEEVRENLQTISVEVERAVKPRRSVHFSPDCLERVEWV